MVMYPLQVVFTVASDIKTYEYVSVGINCMPHAFITFLVTRLSQTSTQASDLPVCVHTMIGMLLVSIVVAASLAWASCGT